MVWDRTHTPPRTPYLRCVITANLDFYCELSCSLRLCLLLQAHQPVASWNMQRIQIVNYSCKWLSQALILCLAHS